MDNTQSVIITAEIDQIIEASYRAIMFDPIDKYTMMNYRNLLSSAISQLKNAGILKAYSIDVQISPGNPDKIEGWISFTPVNVVQEIVMSFKLGLRSAVIETNDHRFDRAMEGI